MNDLAETGNGAPSARGLITRDTPVGYELDGVKKMAAIQLMGSRGDIDFIEMADNTAWHVLAWPENFGFIRLAFIVCTVPSPSSRRRHPGGLPVMLA